jgi:hypothetical protein
MPYSCVKYLIGLCARQTLNRRLHTHTHTYTKNQHYHHQQERKSIFKALQVRQQQGHNLGAYFVPGIVPG